MRYLTVKLDFRRLLALAGRRHWRGKFKKGCGARARRERSWWWARG